ncbi:MAG: class I SAM-dependent methyltransferase [Burkholderiales bacterium]|nr:class I SAM-dependent methyltransferase [Burkholderiales bacterium]
MSPEDLYLDLLKKALTASLYDESAGHASNWLKVNNQVVTLPPGAVLIQYRPLDEVARSEGRDWPLFGFTMAGLKRMDNIQHCLGQVLADGVPGDLIETGVWRGGAAILMRGMLAARGVTDRTVWVADSFEGLPPPSADDRARAPKDPDHSQEAYLKVPLERVQENFRRFGLLDGQVRFLKGWFKDTLPAAPIERLAILRLDGDLYSSTKDALDALGHKVSPGGFVIVDDYHAWEGCRQAVDEYRAARGITAPLVQVDWTAVYWRA